MTVQNTPAFSFDKSAKAEAVKGSTGSEKKGRLHLFAYNGVEGKDRYAVAAEKIEGVGADKVPKLKGFWDRKQCFILPIEQRNLVTNHIENTTYYKVNRNSFKNRLNLSEKDITIDKKTNMATNALIDKLAARERFVAKFTPPKTAFEQNLIQAFINRGMEKFNKYQYILFYPEKTEQSLTTYNDTDIPKIAVDYYKVSNPFDPVPSGAKPEKGSYLIVAYTSDTNLSTDSLLKETQMKSAADDDSPFKLFIVAGKDYKNVISGKPISSQTYAFADDQLI